MSRTSIALTPDLYDYMLSVSLREPEPLARLRKETAAMTEAHMQISPDQGAFMAMLVDLMGAEKSLEVGTFTGYSTLAVALALPPNGHITACDVSEEWTAIAQRYFAAANVEHKLDLRVGPALDTLDALLASGHAGSYDFAFLDADKTEYEAYYERALKLVRQGGLVMIDNVLWDGRVIDMHDRTPDTEAIRRFNEMLHADNRVALSMVPVGDGLTLARKR